MSEHPLAMTEAGLDVLPRYVGLTLDALRTGRALRDGPAPTGGPDRVRRLVGAWLPEVLPERGLGAETALTQVITAVATGSVDPADPRCTAHLHAAPLAVAAAADLAASVLNPSMDSWDQAPAASELERLVTTALAGLVYPGGSGADAVVTTGGTESNLVAMLLARERFGPALQVFCSADAHHSIQRAAWLLGLAGPVVVPAVGGILDTGELARRLPGPDVPIFVVATAGTTDRGSLDPIAVIADLLRSRSAHLHVDAAYGGGLLFSRRACRLGGLERADSVGLDLHKFGWQPLPAGFLAVRDGTSLSSLALVADYLNAEDDQQAGLPDLLGRSIRTSRRPDVLKVAVTFLALGRAGLAELTDSCCDTATATAGLIADRPGLRLLEQPAISTVLFRPRSADRRTADEGNELVTRIRRHLLHTGAAVLGRATVDGTVWLKFTILNPDTTLAQLERLLDAVQLAEAQLTADVPDAKEIDHAGTA